MALVMIGTTACAICGEVFGAEDSIMGFPHFLDEKHKLARYSDSAMHRHCFETWDKRDAFRMAFDKVFPGSNRLASEGDTELSRR